MAWARIKRSKEFHDAALKCIDDKHYNAAATRLYYSVFLLMLNYLYPGCDGYEKHTIIVEKYFEKLLTQNIEVSDEDKIEFEVKVKGLYNNRISADYKLKGVKESEVQSSIDALETIKGKIPKWTIKR